MTYLNFTTNYVFKFTDRTHKYHHAGFDIVANRVMEILGEYMDENHDMNGDLCFWVTGHSMGGGVANLVAAELLHSHNIVNNRTDNVFCYTFASPNTFYLTDNTYTRPNRVYHDETVTEAYREPHGSKYRCIFNVVNADDFVPEVPMRDCGWTKYGRTATISFNSNKKKIVNVVRSETKYSLLNYNWTNTNKFINDTYKGNTQTIRDIVGSFNSIFEDDPKNMRYSAYTFDDIDYLISRDYLTELIIPKNTKPYQKIDSNQLRQYQMPAYFMQYISFAMKTDLNILGVDVLNQSWVDLIVHGAGFKFTKLLKRYISCRDILVDKNNYVKAPHCLESYYYITKTINAIDSK